MRAMRLEIPMKPLRLAEVNSPPLGPQQVRIAISACGVCRTDLHVADGELPNLKLPIIPGHEIVGRIEATGADVVGLRKGDRVGVPWLGWTCGRCEFCLRSQENLCPQARFTGYQIDGGFADETTSDSRYVFPLPASYS